MSAHTPGPWQLDGHNIRSIANKPDWSPKGVKLGEVTSGGVGDEQARANAALIVAAPDLLAACITSLMEFEAEHAIFEMNANHPIKEADIIPTLRAAIARAEGRQP